jgi:hypothetical protein
MRYTGCNSENPEGARFCDACGAPLQVRCASCGASNRPGAKFCNECGAALGKMPAAGAPGPIQSKSQASSTSSIEIGAAVETHEVLKGERKQVTALFADIKGSTELMEDLDPEEARRVIDPALHLMMDAVHRYDGYVVQSTGDGIFALFGLQWRMRIIRNVRYTRRFGCNRSCAVIRRTCASGAPRR